MSDLLWSHITPINSFLLYKAEATNDPSGVAGVCTKQHKFIQMSMAKTFYKHIYVELWVTTICEVPFSSSLNPVSGFIWNDYYTYKQTEHYSGVIVASFPFQVDCLHSNVIQKALHKWIYAFTIHFCNINSWTLVFAQFTLVGTGDMLNYWYVLKMVKKLVILLFAKSSLKI